MHSVCRILQMVIYFLSFVEMLFSNYNMDYFIASSNAYSFFSGISKLFAKLKNMPLLKIQFVVLVALTQVYIVAYMIRNL